MILKNAVPAVENLDNDRFFILFRTAKKPLTTEAQRKARKMENISGFPVFDFLCASVPLCLCGQWFCLFCSCSRWRNGITRRVKARCCATACISYAFTVFGAANRRIPVYLSSPRFTSIETWKKLTPEELRGAGKSFPCAPQFETPSSSRSFNCQFQNERHCPRFSSGNSRAFSFLQSAHVA
ncbi:MAG: hypothetical protein LBI62_07685 [Candidatus Accumulibacter sp.]|jgi:hypothetical protein|nr:hypothetical protein [Accumulibacter sp.]